MKLNPKKCKQMVIDFLQYKSTCSSPLLIGGALIERVSRYKLLGDILSNDLSWNAHCEYIYDKATKRLYGLRILKKSGLLPSDLVSVYCSAISSVLEYASPVWAALPAYLRWLPRVITNVVLIERELENETQSISLKVFPRRDLPEWILLKQGLCFGCQCLD